MKRRSGFAVMGKLIGLVKPLTGYMVLAITMGLIGSSVRLLDHHFWGIRRAERIGL